MNDWPDSWPGPGLASLLSLSSPEFRRGLVLGLNCRHRPQDTEVVLILGLRRHCYCCLQNTEGDLIPSRLFEYLAAAYCTAIAPVVNSRARRAPVLAYVNVAIVVAASCAASTTIAWKRVSTF
jgi:hypothetical protein